MVISIETHSHRSLSIYTLYPPAAVLLHISPNVTAATISSATSALTGSEEKLTSNSTRNPQIRSVLPLRLRAWASGTRKQRGLGDRRPQLTNGAPGGTDMQRRAHTELPRVLLRLHLVALHRFVLVCFERGIHGGELIEVGVFILAVSVVPWKQKG
jgi:hypothetical protein